MMGDGQPSNIKKQKVEAEHLEPDSQNSEHRTVVWNNSDLVWQSSLEQISFSSVCLSEHRILMA